MILCYNLLKYKLNWGDIVKNYLSRFRKILVFILLMNMVFIFNSEKIKNIYSIYMFLIKEFSLDTWVIIANTTVALILSLLPLINGFFRLLFTSRQIGIVDRILLRHTLN